MIFRQEKQKRKERIQIIMTTVAAGRSKTYDLVYSAVFAVVMAVCSWISIPAQVPFTLQTFGVFMAVGVLGGKRGTLAVLVYVCLHKKHRSGRPYGSSWLVCVPVYHSGSYQDCTGLCFIRKGT